MQQNYMMFESLRKLLEQTTKRTHEHTGKIIDHLKKIPYFNQIQNNLGTDHLINIIPILKPLILRETFPLINQCDQYVLVEGQLAVKDNKFQGSRLLEVGKLIDLKQNVDLGYVAMSDCNMIRITRSVVSNLLQKKITESQKERSRKYKYYQRQAESNQNKHKLEIIQNSAFLSYLGNYDLFELAIGCQLKEHSQNSITHKMQEKVDHIGFVVSGKIKLAFSSKNQKGERVKKDSITWFINEKDWIGLEEFLWDKAFHSTGHVYSIGAIILWIPVELFSSKFNVRINHEAITRLMNLIKTKRTLFDRSFNTRLTKQQQMQQQNYYKQPTAELLSKMQALQEGKPVRKRKIYRSKNKKMSANQQEDVVIPDFILHKMKDLEQEPIMLPKLSGKMMFFPEEYANMPVCSAQKKEIDRLENIIRPRNLESYSTIELNPQNLYKTIFNKISYKFPKTTSTESTQRINRRSPLHFNSSIYNNFRVNKRKGNSSHSLSKNMTLSILNTNQ